MKRLPVFILAILLILSLAGCGAAAAFVDSGASSTVSSNTAGSYISASKSPSGSAPTIAPSVPTASPAVTAVPTTAPTIAATEAPRVFDASAVTMQATPNSTCFSEVGYDSDWEVLVVRFRDSGAVYTYLAFPEGEWDKFIAADSLGGWYNAHIKGQYDCESIS